MNGPAPHGHQLPESIVLDAFLLHTLLTDKRRRNEILQLPHHGFHADRFHAALEERNLRMAGTGQELWAHACYDCMKVYEGEDGQFCESPCSILSIYLELLTYCLIEIGSLLGSLTGSRLGISAAQLRTARFHWISSITGFAKNTRQSLMSAVLKNAPYL